MMIDGRFQTIADPDGSQTKRHSHRSAGGRHQASSSSRKSSQRGSSSSHRQQAAVSKDVGVSCASGVTLFDRSDAAAAPDNRMTSYNGL